MQFRLATVIAIVTAIAAALTIWITLSNQHRSIELTSQSSPILTHSARSERQTYAISKSGNSYTLRSTSLENYPSQIWPRIEWSFALSDGSTFDSWRCDDLAVRWDTTQLLLDNGIACGKPYDEENHGAFRIVKYWWPSDQTTNSITQELHIYLIENEFERILAEHKLSLVVVVDVPPTGATTFSP